MPDTESDEAGSMPIGDEGEGQRAAGQERERGEAETTPLGQEAEVQREAGREQARDKALPAGAEIERLRKMPMKHPQKLPPPRGRPNGTLPAKTPESQVSLETRLREFPDNSLVISFGQLRCQACKKTIPNKHRFERLSPRPPHPTTPRR
jgi:hypothetical protein